MNQCPHCKGLYVNFLETKNGKRIYECYDCGKTFKKPPTKGNKTMKKIPTPSWELVEDILTDNSRTWAVRNSKADITINAVDREAALRIAAVLEKDSVD